QGVTAMPIELNFDFIEPFVTSEELERIAPEVLEAQNTLRHKTGAGNDFLGWLNPRAINTDDDLLRLTRCAERLRENSDAVLVVGIGGSYLGARAAIEYIVSPLYNSLPNESPKIWFLGNDLSASHIVEVLKICKGKRVSAIVISKSGTTTEPAVAFRVIKQEMVKRYGDQAACRIVAITDKAHGALRTMADQEGFETFVIPDDIGGRYSVLTPVGLLPAAVAGISISRMLDGAADAKQTCDVVDFWQNPCLQYVAIRDILYRKGCAVELFCGWDPCLAMTAEWLKQLFGESEGKKHKGLFPASATYTTDLHSLGQFVQDGSRVLFETVLSFKEDDASVQVEHEENDLDGINYLAGMTLTEIQEKARRAVAMAHHQGGVASAMLSMDARTPYEYGWLLYFFEYACGVSGYTLNVNPFDQPGVEDYKKNMFALLGKPGSEKPAGQLLQK
ncbi:MAG TPA: glucose-6-phosphate isomerase, partial [Clostridia bacterium]|nr:glucose-6-phosphate isomerase [Clostridia bacterium]